MLKNSLLVRSLPNFGLDGPVSSGDSKGPIVTDLDGRLRTEVIYGPTVTDGGEPGPRSVMPGNRRDEHSVLRLFGGSGLGKKPVSDRVSHSPIAFSVRDEG